LHARRAVTPCFSQNANDNSNRFQILLKELSGQQGIIRKLEDTIESLVRRSGRSSSPLADRQQEMISMFIDVQASARERRDELLDRLNEVIHEILLTLSRGAVFCYLCFLAEQHRSFLYVIDCDEFETLR
jgi:hypothetical protein